MRYPFQKRRGVVAVLVAVCLVALLSIAAIAIDGGVLLEDRRSVQAAADAAALAAANQLYNDWATNKGIDKYGKAADSAFLTASANGYNNDGLTSVVTVKIPPTSGSFVGNNGYAEVTITYNQKRGFSAIFGSGDVPVQGRAVARGKKNNSDIGLLVLNSGAPGALTINGSAGMTVDGRVIVDSSDPKAAVSSGNAGLKSTGMSITGGYTSSGTSSFSANPGTVKTGQTAATDFLSDVPVPDKSGMTVRSTSVYNATPGETLQPGVYQGGIKISGQASVTFAPGTYYLEGGGLSMTSSLSSLTAKEVMIYNAPDSSGTTGNVTLSGGGVTMTPPTSGDYAGMSIFQDRSATAKITLTGGSNWDFIGAVYGASAHVHVTGGSGGSMGSQYISDTLTLSGTSTFDDINPDDGYAPKDIRLVE